MMTRKEAIEFLRCNSYNMESCDKKECNKQEALTMAIEALEKQIPKKPYRHDADYYVCPNCDCQVVWQWFESYCEHCGQAIDWSEEDDIRRCY